MASLNTKPGSSTARQRQTLVISGRRRGFELNEIRSMVGGSIRSLSAAACSEWIERYSGNGLPNPPGKKPSAYAGKKKQPGTIRLITDDHIEQIGRLGWAYFRDARGFLAWLTKHFKTPFVEPVDIADVHNAIRKLGTAERARDVIVALKHMHRRREKGDVESCAVSI